MTQTRLKKGDQVKIIAGSHKGTIAKIVSINPTQRTVKVEGVNVVKRHVKPNMLQPQGGIVEKHVGLDISKVALLQNDKKDQISKVGYSLKKDGTKVRVYKKTNKEIDV